MVALAKNSGIQSLNRPSMSVQLRGKRVSYPLWNRALPVPEPPDARPEDRGVAALAWVVVGALLALGAALLWPILFVGLALLLVAVAPFAAIVTGIGAIRRKGHGVAG
jgi:hypothetical protein